MAVVVAAQPEWAALTVRRRVERIRAWADTIAAHAAELAELECREMGKPVGIGRSFIAGAVAGLKAAAHQALTYPFSETVTGPAGERTDIVRHPLGVTAVITPWNFPVVMVLGALGPLLAAGNSVMVKPSERSPLSTVRLFELAASTGLPPGVLNLVLGDGRTGAALTEHEEVRLVHFTGSVGVGRAVGKATGHRLRRCVLELGGKDPVVIDAGVDPVAIAQTVAFINTGHICTSMERIYVHERIADEFVEALIATARTFTIGDGGSRHGARATRRRSPLRIVRGWPLRSARVGGRLRGRASRARRRGVLPEGRRAGSCRGPRRRSTGAVLRAASLGIHLRTGRHGQTQRGVLCGADGGGAAPVGEGDA
ncbi:aldehyde dehydrogenase family protein [Streptomyces sp. NPDC056453]|uniref:aldehyde dehydrogenase family protein n=1 Tax=Streptomyces sp. NPDC056453 TaxID=3345822 RepID=UPI003699E73C